MQKFAAVAALAAGAFAAPNPATTAAAAPVGNPFTGKQVYANPYYASEILNSAVPSLTGAQKAQATAVSNIGTFSWLDSLSKVPQMNTFMDNIAAMNAKGANPPVIGAFVVYDLPDRDCAAAASNGEYSLADNGIANYENYINEIAAVLKNHSSTDVVLVIEPDSLANLVTNLNVAECSAAESAYKQLVTYAMQTLNLPNVAMYLDAGHAGWLGWSANIGPAAQLFGQLYTGAGSPSQVRGLATNVANYSKPPPLPTHSCSDH